MPFPLSEKFWAFTLQNFQGVSHHRKSLLICTGQAPRVAFYSIWEH